VRPHHFTVDVEEYFQVSAFSSPSSSDSHGWDHARVTQQCPTEFRDSVRRTKRELENLTATPVLGFRAPSFSIVPGREWALDLLIEEGYRYDSSVIPVRRPSYGYSSGRRDPHWLERPAGRLADLPPATLRFCGVNIPAAGAYFRFFPYGLVRAALREYQHRGVPATFYIHRGSSTRRSSVSARLG
jgi:hypothetical protein